MSHPNNKHSEQCRPSASNTSSSTPPPNPKATLRSSDIPKRPSNVPPDYTCCDTADNGDGPLLLPIDSKWPQEDYTRLLDAEDKQAIDEARRSLAQKIRSFAGDIKDKYIVPPKTTDFALMFLPTEGLYAEVVRNAALFEELRDKYKVTAVGATTLSAFLGSLQMGFKTLAIEKRSEEVWDTL